MVLINIQTELSNENKRININKTLINLSVNEKKKK